MIKVLIKRNEENVVSIVVSGHANSAPKGEDLVCAGVSSVITGCFNSIESPENFKLELKEGYASLEAIKPISSHDQVVIETLINSLMTIKEGNEQFVSVKNI